ncbi:MAG TPA: hypothetical protein VK452_05285 [Dissulfurispiraceae bacterium]|nr:hypothetical protein [Dissulfurispiraceae bacterium]
MPNVAEMLSKMKSNPGDIRFYDLCLVCDHYFGTARQKGSSHRIYKTPWHGDPRINVQNDKGKVKKYQVKQVLRAIVLMEVYHGTEK